MDYNETFSPVSKKESLRLILATVAQFDLEFHQMDVKTTFFNGGLNETVYMEQPEGFQDNKKQLVCRWKKSMYKQKQASRHWYLKFHEVISSFSFIEYLIDQCIYLKTSESKFILLISYVDVILLASSDICLLHETKKFLSKNFKMKDFGETSFVIGIEIKRDRVRGILGLS